MFPFQNDPNRFLDDPDVVDMLRVKLGESPVFENILERNYQRIFHFAYRYLGSQHAFAEDITQDVFIKLYEIAPRYTPKAKLSTLLFQMTRNACLNQLRQRKPLSIDARMQTEDGTMSFDVQDPNQTNQDEQMIREEKQQKVRDAIDSLPEHQKAAILLRQYQDLSYEEIAQSIGVSPKAVKSLLNRAKENLSIILKKFLDE